MFRRLAAFLGACFLSAAAAAADFHRVEIRVEPPQSIFAVVVRSGELTQSVDVRDGIALVPASLPLPWSVSMQRFESEIYTRADLERKRPWLIRELGILHGRLQRPSAKSGERFLWLLKGGDSEEVIERSFGVDDRGEFDVRLRSGAYQGVVLGAESATRIRSGIIIKPGKTTDVGVVSAERTFPVSLRVVDAKTRKPVAGARVVWDPPNEILNSTLSRDLYARHWSGVTDDKGIAEIPSIGPLPHSVRWRIASSDYAPAQTARIQLKEQRRMTLPDVPLRQEPSVVVRVQFPRREEENLKNCTLVAGEMPDPHVPRFEAVSRTKLREGDSKFDFGSYGRKRVWIENASKKTLFYRDFEVTSEMTLVDLALQPVEIHGRVTQRGKGVSDVFVTLRDPHDSKVALAEVPAGEDGEYRFTTWQSGKLNIYTIGLKARPGKSVGRASADVDVAGRPDVRVDLEIPASGFLIKVVDAENGAAVRANIKMVARTTAGAHVGMRETDERGRLEVSGYHDGDAKLHVEAKGYRASDLEIAIRPEVPEATVKLARSKPAFGRVVGVNGSPIPGARILGGYSSELADQGFYSISTDGDGRFRLDDPPSSDTIFYVIAPGHALGVTTLRDDRPTTVVLHPPSSSMVTLRQDNAPPEKVFLVMAAPLGGELIPLEVFDVLSEMNGMDLYQLSGSSVDGDVVLAEFLGPGAYELFLAKRGGKPFTYEKLGAISTPLARNVVLSMR